MLTEEHTDISSYKGALLLKQMENTKNSIIYYTYKLGDSKKLVSGIWHPELQSLN